MGISHVALAGFLAFLPVPGIAQSQKVEIDNMPVKETGIMSSGGPLDAVGVGTSILEGLAPYFQITAEGDAVSGVLDIGYTNNNSLLTGSEYRYEVKSRSDRFSLKANVPLGKTSEEKLFDFKGIGNGATATLSFSQYRGKFKGEDRTGRKLFGDALGECIKSSGQNGASEVYDNYQRLRSANPDRDPAIVLAIDVSNNDLQLEAAAGAIDDHCNENTDEVAILRRYASKEAVAYYEKNILAQNPIWFWGVDATLGHKKFEVLDRTAFAIRENSRVSYDGTVYAGIIAPKGDLSFRLAGSYARGYKPLDEVEYCRPAGGGGQDCIKGPDGDPLMEESAFVEGQFKWLISLDERFGDRKIAIAPKVTWNVSENHWAAELPIYLKSDENGKLNGGIRFGYRSDNDDFGAGIFVDIPFGEVF